MGTPEFAVATLDALIKSNHKVVAVVTTLDKPANRGLKLQMSAVKEYAVKNNLPVLQPDKLKSEEFVNKLKEINADLFVVVAFRMLPEVVWSMPKYGTINLHASLLPQYRGAAPINWAVINGEVETGITTFFISHQIDTGDILLHEKIAITEEDNAGTVHDKLMVSGAALLVKTVDAIADKTVKAVPQPTFNVLKHAPKIFRDDCRIDWNKPATEIFNFIRGLSPYPGAFTELQDDAKEKMMLKIFTTAKHLELVIPVGEFLLNAKKQAFIGCGDGALEIIEIQAEGRKRMKMADFLRGFSMDEGTWQAIF